MQGRSLENCEDEEKHMERVSRKKERMFSRQTLRFCRHEEGLERGLEVVGGGRGVGVRKIWSLLLRSDSLL